MASDEVVSDIVLEETFYVFSKKNTIYKVKLSEKGLILDKITNGQTKSDKIQIDDIVGVRCMRSKRQPLTTSSCVCGVPDSSKKDLKVVEETNTLEASDSDVSAYLYIYVYFLKKYRVKSGERREKMTITLRFRSFDRFEDNMREAQRWRTAVRCLIRKRPVPGSLRFQYSDTGSLSSPHINNDDQRSILILLNPKSGPGRGREMFQTRVAPIFAEAEINYDLHVTKYANYAREFMRVRDIQQWRGIVVVGGDGILFEVLNGIFERPDWQDIVSSMPLGIIPSGSGNGLAKAIAYSAREPYDSNPQLVSALNIVKNQKRLMDLVRVQTSKEVMFSFLSIGWGLIADIDIESEKLRAIGSPRFSIWTVARLLGLRTYRGILHYKKVDVNVKVSESAGINRSYSEGDGLCNTSFGTINSAQSIDDILATLDNSDDILGLDTLSTTPNYEDKVESFYSINSRVSAYYSMSGSSYRSASSQEEFRRSDEPVRIYGPVSQLPSLQNQPPDDWKSISGEFIMIHASYQSHIGSDCFIAPDAKLNDGLIWIMVVRAGVSRSALLQILLGLSTGTHVSSPNLEMIPTTAFRLEPDLSDRNHGHLTVDGELVPYGPLQAEIFPKLASVFCR